jgi:cell division protein FtsB
MTLKEKLLKDIEKIQGKILKSKTVQAIETLRKKIESKKKEIEKLDSELKKVDSLTKQKTSKKRG